MRGLEDRPLLMGEVSVDFTLTSQKSDNKMRLGGVAHAARGFWAEDQAFDAAVILPSYLEGSARQYFESLGCIDFVVIGYVQSAPNVTLIVDPTEVSDQGYETLLRDEKSIELNTPDSPFANHQALIFPGSYELKDVCEWLADSAVITIDVAYDLEDFLALAELPRSVSTVLISTSSELFLKKLDGDVVKLCDAARSIKAIHLVLKENRGGSRAFNLSDGSEYPLCAQLSVTVNSVGVGDVFAASLVSRIADGFEEACWRATMAATAYARTTYPEDFRRDIARSSKLSVAELKGLGGSQLPWEARPKIQIYLAAPDFSYEENPEIELALEALEYHNFRIRRPVKENGELPKDSRLADLKKAFFADWKLLQECKLVFGIPLSRDPGTLVEMGMAMQIGLPVVTFDPRREAANTMVIAGSKSYSSSLDASLNSIFEEASKAWKS